MAQTAVEILHEAREILVEKGWTQGCVARDARGKICDVGSRAAVCFCAMGAISKVAAFDDPLRPAKQAIIALRRAIGLTRSLQGVGAWNDAPERTKEEVIAAFDKAIEELERDNV